MPDSNRPGPKDPPPCVTLGDGLALLRPGWTVLLLSDSESNTSTTTDGTTIMTKTTTTTPNFFAVIVDDTNVVRAIGHLSFNEVGVLVAAASANGVAVAGLPPVAYRPCDIPFTPEKNSAAMEMKSRQPHSDNELKKCHKGTQAANLERFVVELNRKRETLTRRLGEAVVLPTQAKGLLGE